MDRCAQESRAGSITTRNGIPKVQTCGGWIGDLALRKPNYRFERAERDRMKQAKKEEKARRQQERASHQKSEQADPSAPSAPKDG